MKSAKCPQCGFVGWSDAEVCKKCGASLSPAPVQVAPPPGGNFVASYPNYYATPPAELNLGWAVAALVLGILNVLFLSLFIVPPIVGIVIAAVALSKAKRYPHQYGGKPLAVGGLITSIVSVVLTFAIIAAIAIPNILASRMAANEGAAMNSLRRILSAEAVYQSTVGRGHYGTLNDLQRASLITPELAIGSRWGYEYKVEVVTDRGDGFKAVGVPTEYRTTGRRSFFIDETGVLRGEDSHGLEANGSSPPVGLSRDYPERRSGTQRSSRYGDDE